MGNSVIQRIKVRSMERLAQNDSAHDYFHAERVANLTEMIRKREGGDKLITAAASYAHDWCASNYQDHVSEPALAEIRADFISLEFPTDKTEQVIDAVRHHEDYNFSRENTERLSQECLILQDADRLDALGAIGIARCVYTSAIFGCPIGTPENMHDLDEQFSISQLTSAVQHFYTKLLKLKDAMNTEYARQLAQGRHDFMVEFLRRFKLEWEGKI